MFTVNDLHAPSPEPPACATETRQSGQRVSIELDPLEQEPTDDDPGTTIRLPNLQTTQGFIDALKGASLETSGMQPEDIESVKARRAFCQSTSWRGSLDHLMEAKRR